MHAAAKAQIKNAMKKNKSGDPRFLTITAALKARLQSAVGEHYWKKAQDNLSHFLKQKRKELQLRATKSLSSGHEATLKPNASAIREIREYVHQICTKGGLGLELNC